MTIQVDSPKVYTIQGVPLSVTGIAQVKKFLINYIIFEIILTFKVYSIILFYRKKFLYFWYYIAKMS